MSISSLPAGTEHRSSNIVAALRAGIALWREGRARRIAERRAIALLQSIEPEVLQDVSVAAHPAAGPHPPACSSSRTEVGPMLAIYLPFCGRSSVNEKREQRR